MSVKVAGDVAFTSTGAKLRNFAGDITFTGAGAKLRNLWICGSNKFKPSTP